MQAALAAVPQLVGRGDGVGSNSLVVGGARTSTGKPLLANDPHLATGIPGIWSQVGLHCRTVSAACPFDVSGFSFAGMPGVIIGHNQSIAWGLTNLGPDVSDFYLEQLQGDTTLRDGSWVPLQTRTETIKVAGGADRTINVRSTVHGPVLSDVLSDVRPAAPAAPVTGGDPNASYAVVARLDRPDPEQDGRRPLRDRHGASTSPTSGMRPRTSRCRRRTSSTPTPQVTSATRRPAWSRCAPRVVGAPPGYWPAPGWTSSYDWKGWVPFAQMPWVEDPKDGFIVTANQAVTRGSVPT